MDHRKLKLRKERGVGAQQILFVIIPTESFGNQRVSTLTHCLTQRGVIEKLCDTSRELGDLIGSCVERGILDRVVRLH